MPLCRTNGRDRIGAALIQSERSSSWPDLWRHTVASAMEGDRT
ncbi:MAG: hypothetical protein ACK559_14800 [bacterium]